MRFLLAALSTGRRRLTASSAGIFHLPIAVSVRSRFMHAPAAPITSSAPSSSTPFPTGSSSQSSSSVTAAQPQLRLVPLPNLPPTACLMEKLVGPSAPAEAAEMWFDEQSLVLSPLPIASRTAVCVPFAHSSRCPMFDLQRLFRQHAASTSPSSSSSSNTLSSTKAANPAFQTPRLRIGSSVLLENSAGELLITKRAGNMRSFPGAWVFPGGSLDAGETPRRAAAREAKEETGVDVDIDSLRLLCLWESVFPPHISIGQPTRHSLVCYYTGRLKRNNNNNNNNNNENGNGKAQKEEVQLCLQPSEVEKAEWLTLDELMVIANTPHTFPGGDKENNDVWRTMIEYGCSGEEEKCEKRVVVSDVVREICGDYTPLGPRGIAQGHRYAIRTWLAHRRRKLI